MAAMEGVSKMNLEAIGRHGPPLIFCDTFNHEENEEMHLDLVSFPRPVCIREVRVIARGTRPHVAIDRPGVTHPPSFKLELFIRNLNRMQSVTFDKLGVLDYREGISFQLNTKSEAATDVVVLRGWYTRLTVCLYGNLTTIQEVPPKIPEQPPAITPEIPAVEKPATEETQKPKDVQSSPIKVETTNDEKIKKDIDQTAPDTNTAVTSTTIDETATTEKVVVSPTEEKEKLEDKADSVTQKESTDATDDLFEPLTPDKSPTDLFLSDEGDDLDQDGYEAILSDEEIMDDEHPYDDTDVLDFQLFAEDTWMSVSVSFNPYQCDLSKLMSFPSSSFVGEPDEGMIDKFKTLLGNYNKEYRNEKSVNLQESIADSTLIPMIANSKNQKELLSCLSDLAINALDLKEALHYPIAANIRRLKSGMKLAAKICESNEDATQLLMKANVQEKLFNLLTTEHMSSSVKLVALEALHSSVEFPSGMDNFISTKTQGPGGEALTGYKRLIDLLLADQTVRVVTAAKSLFHRVHFYEMLGSLQTVVEKIIENTNSLLATRNDTDHDVDASIDIEGIDLKSVLNAQQLEIIIGCLEEVYNVLLHANQLLVQPHIQSFPTSVKITTENDDVTKDPYPMLYRMLSHRKLLESILVLFSCPVGFLPPVFTAIRDIFFYLLQSQEGLLFLLSDPESINEIVRLLTQTETDFHYSEAPSLQVRDFLRDSGVADHCTPQHLGLLLIYHLQTLQAVDQLKLSHNSNSNGVDLDGADVLSTLHSLYSMTFTALGKSAVSTVLSMSTNLECLLPFVEGNEKTIGDTKMKKSVSSRYASVLLLLTIQGSENVEILDRFGDRMWEIGQKDKEYSLGQLNHWLSPVREVNFEIVSIPTLVEYVKSKADDLNNLNTACGILTTVRVIRYLAAPQTRLQHSDQKDLSLNLASIQLFSANAMDVFIKLTQKINEFLQRPWRLGQPFTSGHCYYVVSIVLPLLALVNQLLTELLSTSVYQFKDTRLLTELMVLYSIMSSVSGSLSSIAHKIQNEIVDVLMAFTRPVLQTTDTEDAINNSVWLLMLKELLQYTMSRPQFFLGGLSLLSELLPIPLPINTLEDLPNTEIEELVKHRLLWSVHLNPLTSTIQSMLKDLSGSCCHSLQLILRRVCCQLADISASMALTVVRTLLEVVNNDLPKRSVDKQENEEDKSPVDSDKMVCFPHVMRVITLIAYLSSQPAVKSALLFFLKPGNPDEVPFPDLLNSLLHILQMTSDEMAISRLKYCVVTIIQSLCDPQISLTLFDNPYASNQLGDAMPDRTMFSSICSALLENIGSSSQSYATILQVLRTIVMLTEHDYGMFHIKLALKKDKEVFYRLFQRLCSSFKPGIPGPDSLSTLSTVTELLQLLLPPKNQLQAENPDKPEDATTTDVAEGNQSVVSQSRVDVQKHEKDEETMEVDENEKKEKTFSAFQNADQVYLRQIHLSVLDLRELMKTGDKVEHPVEMLETLLEKSCKEDETLEALLNGVISLKKVQEITDSDLKQDTDVEPVLPATQPLQTLFNKRAAFSAGEDVSGRVSPTLWYSTPPPDDIDVENELISCDLEEVNDKYFPDFDLKAELEKGLLSTIDDSPKRKRGLRGLGKRKFASLILEKGDKKSKQEGSERGRGRGIFRGGRGGPRYDNFRARKQNTSRPPSMHVDDFMAMEGGRGRGRAGQGETTDRSSPGSSSIRKIQALSRNLGDQRLDGGFLDGGGRWPLSNTSSRREVSITPHAMPQLRNQPSWEAHQSTLDGGFLEQRGFQRNNWGTPASVNYRGFRETTYRETPVRGGYWAGPQQDTSRKEQSFLPPPPANFDNYRTGGNRGRSHMRSFTR